jgi:hypothetical protein
MDTRALALRGLVVGALAAGCSDRPIMDTYDETDDSTATLPITTGSTSLGPTTAGPTSSGPSTGPSTVTATITTDPTISTSTPPTSDTWDDSGNFCGDGWCSPDESCETCPSDCLCSLPDGVTQGCGDTGAAEIFGTTSFGYFEGTRAYFAWEGFPDSQWSTLTLHFFDAGVDIEAAKQAGPWSGEHFALRSYTNWSFNETGWLGGGDADFEVSVDSQWALYDGALEIYDRGGNWDAVDPGDPPVLYGFLSTNGDVEAPQGPFAAVFCDAFVSQIIPE